MGQARSCCLPQAREQRVSGGLTSAGMPARGGPVGVFNSQSIAVSREQTISLKGFCKMGTGACRPTQALGEHGTGEQGSPVSMEHGDKKTAARGPGIWGILLLEELGCSPPGKSLSSLFGLFTALCVFLAR